MRREWVGTLYQRVTRHGSRERTSKAIFSAWCAPSRWLPYYFEMLPVDALFIPITAKRQRAFDIVAKMVVVREPQ